MLAHILKNVVCPFCKSLVKIYETHRVYIASKVVRLADTRLIQLSLISQMVLNTVGSITSLPKSNYSFHGYTFKRTFSPMSKAFSFFFFLTPHIPSVYLELQLVFFVSSQLIGWPIKLS